MLFVNVPKGFLGLATVLVVGAALPPRSALAWPVAPPSPSPEAEPQAPPEVEVASPPPAPAVAVENQPAAGATGPAESAPTVAPPARRSPRGDVEEPKIHTVREPDPPDVVPNRVFMANVGTHMFVGKGAGSTGLGLRGGAFLGVKMGNRISANGELVIDLVNVESAVPASVTEVMADVTFSPLLHLPLNDYAQFLLGPRLGVFYLKEDVSSSLAGFGPAGSAWGWGWALGLNAGLVTALRQTRIGALISFSARLPEKLCSTPNLSPESCRTENLQSAKTLSAVLVLML